MYIFAVGQFTARLGSVTVLAQQFPQEIAPPLNDAQNEIVAVSVSRGQMPGIHKAMNITFGSATCFEQSFMGCAFVDVSGDELPAFFLLVPNGVIGKFGCVD